MANFDAQKRFLEYAKFANLIEGSAEYKVALLAFDTGWHCHKQHKKAKKKAKNGGYVPAPVEAIQNWDDYDDDYKPVEDYECSDFGKY